MTRAELVTTFLSIAALGIALTVLPPGSDAQTGNPEVFQISASWQADNGPDGSFAVGTRVGVPVRLEGQNLRLELVMVDRCLSDQHFAARVKGRTVAPVQLSISHDEGQLGTWALGGVSLGTTPMQIDETLKLGGCNPT